MIIDAIEIIVKTLVEYPRDQTIVMDSIRRRAAEARLFAIAAAMDDLKYNKISHEQLLEELKWHLTSEGYLTNALKEWSDDFRKLR